MLLRRLGRATYPGRMSLSDKIKSFASSPQGRRLVDKGRTELSKPENQRRLRGLLGRLRSR